MLALCIMDITDFRSPRNWKGIFLNFEFHVVDNLIPTLIIGSVAGLEPRWCYLPLRYD